MNQGYRQGYRLSDLENVLSERGWSQADLARRSGLSAPTIGRAAAARAEVSDGSAKKIASALRVQVGTLCHDRGRTLSENTDSVADGANEYLDFDPARMREAMADLGMNPTELAARTELSVTTVSSALRGLRQPQKDTIARIATAVGKAPAELCSKSETSDNTPVQSSMQAAGDELRLVAGQARTALYPVEINNAHETPTPANEPAQQEVTGPVTAADGYANDTLGSLLWRLQQARQMVASLMDHIGNLETQVGQALRPEDASGKGGANDRSVSQ